MRRHRNEEAPVEVALPSSAVHILYTEEDLRAAVERASEFDERTSDMLQSRSQRYRTLAQIPADPVDAG